MTETLLDRILAPGNLTVRFQPVVGWTGEEWVLRSMEGLVGGPEDSLLRRGDVLFEYVRRKHAEPQMDRCCVCAVLQAAGDLGPDARISLNVHAATLERDPEFPNFVVLAADMYGIRLTHVVMEVVEHVPPWAREQTGRSIRMLRDRGIRFGLDDIGTGQASYNMMLEIRPDFFKIDRSLVQGASDDRNRRIVLRSLADLARDLGGITVAEGVENVPDLKTAVEMGVDAVQGFLTGRPATVEAMQSYRRVAETTRLLPSPTADISEPWLSTDDWVGARRLRRAAVPHRVRPRGTGPYPRRPVLKTPTTG